MTFSFNSNGEHTVNTASAPLGMEDILNRAPTKETDLISSLLLDIFILLILVALALFGYRLYLTGSVKTKQNDIHGYALKINIQNLDGIKSLAGKVDVTDKIVEQYPFASTAFMAVGESVEKNVVYKSFNLSIDDKSNNKSNNYSLLLYGVAPNYKTIIQQMDTFKSEPFSRNINSVEVKSLSPNKSGGIDFALNLDISIKGVYPNTQLFSIISSDPLTNLEATTTNATSTTSLILMQATSTLNNNVQILTNGVTTGTSTKSLINLKSVKKLKP